MRQLAIPAVKGLTRGHKAESGLSPGPSGLAHLPQGDTTPGSPLPHLAYLLAIFKLLQVTHTNVPGQFHFEITQQLEGG